MSHRAVFFTILGVVVVFLLFVGVLLLSGGSKTVVDVPSPSGTSVPVSPLTPTVPSGSASSGTSAPAVRQPIDVTAFARSFVERFGSFSNQSNFENIRELQSLMTPVMQVWAERSIAEAEKKVVPGAPYYGMTTRAVTAQMVALDEGKGDARVLVKTQRREVKDRETPRIFSQDILLTLRKVEGEWKVEAAEWK